MISEAKLAANRANALLSKGPTSPEGRAKSSQNALKHGMRSARLARFAETSYSFEEKQRKWMSIADPRNDIEEFIISQAAVSASKVQRVQLAEAEHAEHLVENADAIELSEIHDIGCCLFFDPCGPTALYGKQGSNWRKKRTSWRGEAIDPHDPKKLVDVLYSSAAGCRWLRERWEELGAHLKKSKGFWSSADKLRAIRLLGRQPVDAQDDVRVAAIFLASHAIRRTGKTFEDLLSDMSSETLSSFVKDVTDRCAEEIDVSDVTNARQMLLGLVEENVAMIDEALEEHQANAQKKGEKSSDRLGFDESPRGVRIAQYEARCISGFHRGLEVYRKWQARKGGERRAESGGGCGQQEHRLRPTDYGRASRADLGWPIPDPGRVEPRMETEVEGGADRAGAIDVSDEVACGGIGTQAATPCVEAVGSSQVAGTEAVSSAETTNGTWDVPAAPVGCSDEEACGGAVGSSEDGGLDNAGRNVTNEPNVEKEVVHTQNQNPIGVAADPGEISGLDKQQTNPRPVVEKTWQEERREQWERFRREFERRKLAKCERALAGGWGG